MGPRHRWRQALTKETISKDRDIQSIAMKKQNTARHPPDDGAEVELSPGLGYAQGKVRCLWEASTAIPVGRQMNGSVEEGVG